CIYLLMPMVGNPEGEPEGAEERRAREERLRELERELDEARKQGADLTEEKRKEIEKLKKEKIQALKERLAVRALEIDGSNGKLYYRDPERVEIRDQTAADRLIKRDRKERAAGGRELYYLILYPRDPNSGYPTREQRQ